MLLEEFLFSPERAVLRAQESAPVGAALCSFALAGLSLAVARAVLGEGTLRSLWLVAAFGALARVSLGALMTAVVHLFSEALGGRGRVGPLFALMGLSDSAWALMVPAALFARALAPGAWWTSLLCGLAVGFLVLALRVRSVRHNYGLSRAGAWTAVCLPYAAAAAVCALFLTLAVAGAVQQLALMFS